MWSEKKCPIKKVILTHLVPDARNDDGDVTNATDDDDEAICESKAVVAHSGHPADRLFIIFL